MGNGKVDLKDRRKEIRCNLKGKNIYRWKKLAGELECDSNTEALNKIVRELDRRIEEEKANGNSTFSYNRG